MTLAQIWQDVRFGLRTLRRSPGFFSLAVLALALGIGSTTVIVSFADATLLSLLEFRDALGIMVVGRLTPEGRNQEIHSATYEHWRDKTGVFSELAATDFTTANLTGVDDPEPLMGNRISASLFPMLGVEALSGRAFTVDDERPGAAPVAMISERLWRGRYQADPGVIGRGIRLNDTAFTLVGVAPQGLYGYGPMSAFIDFYLPLMLSEDAPGRFLDTGGAHDQFNVYGRLQPGKTPGQALAELEPVTAALDAEAGGDRDDWKIYITPFYERVMDDRGETFYLYFAAAAAVLLIACVNVALMMLARATRRRRELAVRNALGAGRRRLARQLLTESLLLALAGGAAGVALAYALMPVVISTAPANMQRSGLEQMSINLFTLACALLISMGTAVAFGLAPALRGSRFDVVSALKNTVGAGQFDRRGRRFQDSLVAVAVGSSLTLLIVAALLGTSFLRALEVDPGYRSENVLTARVPLPIYKYEQMPARARFYNDIVDRAAALPGVRSAAAAVPLPLGNIDTSTRFVLEGETAARRSDMRGSRYGAVTSDFFETLGIPLLGGRVFDRGDSEDAPPAAIVNQAFAKEYWPGQDPIGKRLNFNQELTEPWVTIVGLVGDVHYMSLTDELQPIIYRPVTQGFFGSFGMTLLARSEGDPLALAPALRQELSKVDPEAPLTDIRTMDRVIDESLAGRRYLLTIVCLFAGLALLLSLVGVYGVVSYTVAQRTQEIGLRMALGAQRSDTFLLVLRRVGAVIVAGLALGVAASFFFAGLIEKQLYQVRAADPLVLVGAAAALLFGALLAASIPARRAMRVEPMQALRYE